MNPKVSIIVPVYNVEEYLERCVNSLRSQTLGEIEIILVDDGSTDGSGKLCDKYGNEDGRIRVIHKQNEGQGIARNRGLDIAAGKYVAFVDSDDYMERTAYEKIYHALEAEQAQLCSFGYVKQDAQGTVFYRSGLERECLGREEIRTEFVGHFFGDDPGNNKLSGVSACMTVFSREVIDGHGIRFRSEREVASEDTIFNLDFCLHIERALVLSEEFYHYCQKGDSFSKGYRPERYGKGVEFCDILNGYALKYGIGNLVDNRIRMFFWGTLMDCIKQETGRIGEEGFRPIYRQVRELCRREETGRMLEGIRQEGMNEKQRLLLYFVKKSWVAPVMLMGYMRTKRGL